VKRVRAYIRTPSAFLLYDKTRVRNVGVCICDDSGGANEGMKDLIAKGLLGCQGIFTIVEVQSGGL
jgi:hypothetical protein